MTSETSLPSQAVAGATPIHGRGLPMPSPDRDLWDSVMSQGFATYPARLANFEKFKAAERGEIVDYLPVRLDVENVSRCNFRCTMCQVSEWPKGQRAEDMTLEDFKALMDQQYGLVEIKLQGMGEPLMNAGPYFDMIAYARARHIWVRSTNNGSLLHLKDNYKRLIDADICEAQLSIDGATKETFERIRVGGKFERVAKNCEALNAYGRDNGRHRTRMWVVVQDANFHELEAFPQLAGDLGFARLTFSLDLTDWGQDTWREHNDKFDRHQDFTAERAEALIELGEKAGVEVTFWYVDSKYDAAKKETLCPWPFERAYISSDMRVVPCCMIANPGIEDLGDARDFGATWNEEAMAAFRRDHIEGRIPDACKTCYVTHAE